MSLWWTKRDQLDPDQVRLIESLSLTGDFLVCGPPGSGKTNVLLRRAQFVRLQGMPNVLVLTYTRPLVEFVKTGCFDDRGREIFPRACVDTLQGWVSDLYRWHGVRVPAMPTDRSKYGQWRNEVAAGALSFIRQGKVAKYDALFVDEVQDLYESEVKLLRQWTDSLFFTGDSRQRIFGSEAVGLPEAQKIVPAQNQHKLTYHYRLAKELCQVADRLLNASGPKSMSETCHYQGPKPGRVDHHGQWAQKKQLAHCAQVLKSQIRVYADLIRQGDRIGVIVPRKDDRELVWKYFEKDSELAGKSKIIKSNDGSASDRTYDPSFGDVPISILTVKGCKGIEFRALHWLFCDKDSHHYDLEHYYTVLTRAKTTLDIYHEGELPQELARSCPPSKEQMW